MSDPMQAVYIEWEDASAVDTDTGWVDRETAKAPVPHMFRQLGFVYQIDADAVVLTEAFNDVSVSPRTRIPLGMVRRWVYLDEFLAKEATKKRRR